MKIAIPVANNELCLHFGHCEVFEFYEVKEEEQKILNKEVLTPPPHEPGVLPRWISSQGADLVIAGGMGASAQNLFHQAGVKVITGAQGTSPQKIVEDYLNNSLQRGKNTCDH